ncbi:MAG: A/G-specific adenine glycosylase [Thermoplasmata archaeon]
MTGRFGRSVRPDAGTVRALLTWFRHGSRPLPWRRNRDPYRVWVAEVLLQQTRVEQAGPYFERFVARFPNVRSLAKAPEPDILKVWEGAGYYARARSLGKAAREVVRDHAGAMPRTVLELQMLPGVGPYIARAVASIAFNVPVVAMEANGRRVAARWWAETGNVRQSLVARALERRLTGLLPSDSPGEFNEAVMELGETVCLPISPRCGRCPVAHTCRAYATLHDPGSIPARPAHRPRPHVRAALVVVEAAGRFLVQRRGPRGLLAGLYEFPGGTIEPGESPEGTARRELEEETGLRRIGPLESVGVVHHSYSHFRVDLHVYRARLARPRRVRTDHDRRWVSRAGLRRLPLPRATEKVLDLLRESDERSGGRRRPPRAR